MSQASITLGHNAFSSGLNQMDDIDFVLPFWRVSLGVNSWLDVLRVCTALDLDSQAG